MPRRVEVAVEGTVAKQGVEPSPARIRRNGSTRFSRMHDQGSLE
jgi:hypothetical protein